MKTLITRAFKMTPQEKSLLESLGLEITFWADEHAEVPEPEQYEAVISYELFKYNDIARFTSLRYMQLTSAGMDHMPMQEIRRRGIVLNNARGVYSVPMAEFALCGVLQLYKQSRRFWENQQAHRWSRLRGLQEIAGKQVLVVGVGSIGCEVAKRFAAFDASVTGVDILPVRSPYFERVVLADKLDTVLPQADIVVVTLPLMPSTRHMFNAERFNNFREGALLVNLSRGAIVDQQAMVGALAAGRLGGAVLDVFEQEPLPEDDPLWDMPNVLVTPHNSFLSESNNRSMFRVVLENLQKYLQNDK